MTNDYIYLGDRFTDPNLRGKECVAVRRPDGKCIRGKNGNMLVIIAGQQVIVTARLLRKISRKLVSGTELTVHFLERPQMYLDTKMAQSFQPL